jgi:hypothetical protein
VYFTWVQLSAFDGFLRSAFDLAADGFAAIGDRRSTPQAEESVVLHFGVFGLNMALPTISSRQHHN